MMSLEDAADQPLTKDQFAGFLDRLADSLVEDPEIWENASLDQFLRAWSTWVHDMDGYFTNRGEAVPEQPTWQVLAKMLLAARIYE